MMDAEAKAIGLEGHAQAVDWFTIFLFRFPALSLIVPRSSFIPHPSSLILPPSSFSFRVPSPLR
jgi:hypothetical protein